MLVSPVYQPWRACWREPGGGSAAERGFLGPDEAAAAAAAAVGAQAALAAKLRTARRLTAKLEAARDQLAEQARPGRFWTFE